MTSLFAISADLDRVAQDGFYIDKDTGEIAFNAEATELAAAIFEDKLDACLSVAERKESLAAELQRVIDLQRNYKKEADAIRRYIKRCMEMTEAGREGKAVETSQHRVKIVKNPPSVSIIDETRIPAEYMLETVTRKPNKLQIKAAIERGEYVEGAALVQTKRLKVE